VLLLFLLFFHLRRAPNPTDQGLSDIEDELDSLNLGATDRAVDASGRQRIDDSIAYVVGFGFWFGFRLAPGFSAATVCLLFYSSPHVHRHHHDSMRQGGAPTGSRLAMLRSPRSGGPNNENVSAVLDRIQSEGCLCSDKDNHLCPHGGPVGVNLAFMERPSPPPDPNARYSPCPGYEGDDAMH
jgi:hypothetical protein